MIWFIAADARDTEFWQWCFRRESDMVADFSQINSLETGEKIRFYNW
jgi:hypothetical protein